MAAGVTQRIDALHGETGQILHVDSLSGQPARRRTIQRVRQKLPWAAQTELLAWILPLVSCGVKRNDYNGLWSGFWSLARASGCFDGASCPAARGRHYGRGCNPCTRHQLTDLDRGELADADSECRGERGSNVLQDYGWGGAFGAAGAVVPDDAWRAASCVFRASTACCLSGICSSIASSLAFPARSWE